MSPQGLLRQLFRKDPKRPGATKSFLFVPNNCNSCLPYGICRHKKKFNGDLCVKHQLFVLSILFHIIAEKSGQQYIWLAVCVVHTLIWKLFFTWWYDTRSETASFGSVIVSHKTNPEFLLEFFWSAKWVQILGFLLQGNIHHLVFFPFQGSFFSCAALCQAVHRPRICCQNNQHQKALS